jgi:hypothetical protein
MERKSKKLIKDLKKNLNLDAQPQLIPEGGEFHENISSRPESKTHTAGPGTSGLDEDEDDDFGFDPDRYVPFDEKEEFADSLKRISKEGLT